MLYIVIGSDSKTIKGWGRGKTIEEAYAEAYSNGGSKGWLRDYLVYEVCPGSICITARYGKEHILYFQYPVGEKAPKLIKKVINGKVEDI